VRDRRPGDRYDGQQGVERHGIEFVLDALQDLKAPGALGVLVIPVLSYGLAASWSSMMRQGNEFLTRDKPAQRELGFSG